MHKIMVAIAPGSEEIEAVTIIDVLRRAELEVDGVSVCPQGNLQITASRGVKLVADCHINDVVASDYQMLVLPGGLPGSEVFRDNQQLVELLTQRLAGQWLAAICAAPAVVLATHRICSEAQMTCHPAFQQQIPAKQLSQQRVVVDLSQRLITSQGPGTALEFSLSLVEQLLDQDTATSVATPMVLAVQN